MKGLIIKDLLLIKYHICKGKKLFFLIAFILLTAIFLNDLFLLLNIMLLFMLINSVSYTFINEEESGFLDFLYVTTNISVSKIVLARYLSYLSLTIFFIVAFSLVFGINNIIHSNYSLREFSIIMVVIIVASLIYVILSTPFLYQFLQNGFIILAISLSILILVSVRFNILNQAALNHLMNLNGLTWFLIGIFFIGLLFILSSWISASILKAKMTNH